MTDCEARVLVVEDNPGDQRLTLEAFRELKMDVTPHLVKDGEEAISYLNSVKEIKNLRPTLILLDLNLPNKDGKEVLAEIKDDPELRDIPVVVFSTSGAAEDIKDSFDLKASGYITKPIDLEQYYGAIAGLERYWNLPKPLPIIELSV